MLGNFKKIFRGTRSGPPRIIQQPQSVYDALPGSTVTLLVMPEPKQSYSTSMDFEWQHCLASSSRASQSWTPLKAGEKDRIRGINTSTLLITDLLQNDAGGYRCLITNDSGMTLSRPATLTIVVPPKIETHPIDVVNAITGSSVSFAVVINSGQQQLGSGGEGGKEREGAGIEGLQLLWEVLGAGSLCGGGTIVNGGADASANDVNDTPETPHERIFREHYPDLRHYLNTSSILPYLSKYSLVTADQLEELTLPVLTNTRKVDLLLNWLPRSTVDFLVKFVLCLKEANDHLAHGELAEKLEAAMETEMARRGSQVSQASPPTSPMLTSPSPSIGQEVGVAGEGWQVVREEEGRVEGTSTPTLHLLHVEKCRQGKYRCRVVYKSCTVISESASLTVLEDDEIIEQLLQDCTAVDETSADTVVANFLEQYGNSSRLAKKALVAVLQSSCEQVLNLVQYFTRGKVPLNFIQDGMSPLHVACVKGHWRIVQQLISFGASKTALTQEGRNAVHLVCERGDNNSLQFLIHTGAETLVNVQDKYGKTPLHLACEAAQKITPSKLISHDMRDIKTVIQNLLKLQSSLRAADENGQTPLHLAAKAGHPWIVEVFLLCNTAALDNVDTNGDTALHIATAMNWGNVVFSLLERGANEMIENKDHMTPLALAEVKGHTEVANILQRKPGTVKRDRKQTVYVTATQARPRSANLDADGVCAAIVLRGPQLAKKRLSEEQPDRKSWYQMFASQNSFSPTKHRSGSKLFQSHEQGSKSFDSQDAVMSGYVQKMEGKKWSRFWCQLLADSSLCLYKNQEDQSVTTILPLVGYKVESVPSSQTIQLLHPKGKPKNSCIFKLDESEFTQWVELLEKAVRGELLPTPHTLTPSLSPH